jgi:chromosome segregation ATPase
MQSNEPRQHDAELTKIKDEISKLQNSLYSIDETRQHDTELAHIKDEIANLRGSLFSIDKNTSLMRQSMDGYTDLVQMHHRSLYRSNGDPGLIDKVEEVLRLERERLANEKTMQAEMRERRGDLRKAFYASVGSIVLLIAHIVISALT